MKAQFEQVREFQKAIGQATPGPDNMAKLTPDQIKLECEFLTEEVLELKESTILVEQVDAYLDIIYYCLGGLVKIGLEPTEAFNMVHKANMNKFWPDGKPHFNKDGKVIKPPTWTAPTAEMHKYLMKLLRHGARRTLLDNLPRE